MMATRDDPVPAPGRSTRLRHRTTAWVLTGLGAGAATFVSLALAIVATQPQPVHQAQIGEQVVAGRWQVRATGARYQPANRDAKQYFERQNALVIDLELRNLSAQSSNSYTRLTELAAAGAGKQQPVHILARDGSFAGGLHPNMAEYVTAYWPWPEGQAAPEEVKLSVKGEIYKARDNLYGAPGWFPTEIVAEVTLPVGGKP